MAGEFKGLTIKFRGDASDLTKALSTINSEMRVTTRSANEVERILRMKGASNNVQMLAQKVKLAGDRCKEWRDRLDTLKSAQAELGERTDENAEQYDKLSEEIERAQAKLEAYTQELHSAEAAYDRSATMIGKLGQKMQDVGTGMKSIGDGMQAAGSTLTKTVTAPLIALGTVSVKSAVEVDTALTGVRKTLDATEEQYQKLKSAAIESSKVQPVDAATILNIEALGAQLGFSVDELQEFSRVASGLDVATDMNWESAATSMAQFFNIMDTRHELVGNYSSTIVALGNNLATTESAVSDMGMRIAAAGKQIGLSEADVLGLAGALTSMGVTAEAGGSAISTIMSNIDKDVAKGSKKLEVWAKTAGMSAEQFAASWKSSPVEALAAVLAGMNDATNGTSNMSLMLEDLGISSILQTDIMKRLAGNTSVMTDAVNLANDAWRENTALDTEVANRNESIASKFQVLANKMQAIAIEVGGPLADALLGVVDAAEPLIKKVGDVAKAFAEMDTEQQRSIIKWAAMAAAAGPLLTVFGKLTSGAGSVLETIGKGAQGFAAFYGQIKRGNGVMSGLKVAFEGAETGLLGLKVALGGLALAATIALLAAMTERWRENNRRAKQFSEAMQGMKANTEGLGRSLTIGADGIKSFGDASADAKSDVDGLIKSIQDHNERNAQTRRSAEESIGMLNQYKEVVDRLAGAGEASSEDMALLEWALKGIEEQTGKTYDASEVLAGKIKDENGEYVDLKKSIDEVIDAKRREAEASAVQSMLTDTIIERKKAEKELAKVTEELETRTKNFLKANEDSINPLTHRKYTEQELLEIMQNSDTTYQDLHRDQLEAQRALDGLTEEEKTYTQMLADATKAEQEHWGEREKIIMTTEKMRKACEDLGIDTKKLSQSIEDAGVSTSDFAKIGADQFAMMAQMAGGDIGKLTDMIATYNETEFADKYGELHVDGYGQVVDAIGTVYEWNGTEFVPKFLSVDTNAEEAAGQVDDFNRSAGEVKDRNSLVDATVKGKDDVDKLTKSEKDVPKSVSSSVTATVYGKGDVDTLLSTLMAADGRNYSVTFTTYQRTVKSTETVPSGGGPKARGAIISHATGDILMANRRGDGVMYDAYNRIGEQGAEAIVPLQKPFADGFADIIADSLAKHGMLAGGPSYNLYIDQAQVNGDAEIQAVMLGLFDTLVRKGAMNIG